MNSPPDPAPASVPVPAPELPLYEGIKLGGVMLVDTPAAAAEACRQLLAEPVLGFDTESKPTFTKGEVSTGPHLIQLATDARAWLFPVRLTGSHPGLRELLESPRVLKVGFGLGSDLAQLRGKLAIEAQGILDLSQALPREAPNKTLGAKTAVARYLGQRMQKSKHVTTSNWGNPQLNERQMLYAANDAQVALRVYRLALAAGDLNPKPPRAPQAGAGQGETHR